MHAKGAVLRSQDHKYPFRVSKPLSIEEFELEELGTTEVLVQIGAAGVCHSDLSVVQGSRSWPLPMVLGHEASGTVLEVGTDVDGLIAGDQVVMTFLPRCEGCANCRTEGLLPCSTGVEVNNRGVLLCGESRVSQGSEKLFHHVGVSGFATHAVVDQASVVKVPNEVPAEIAAVLGCAMLTGGGALLNSGKPRIGESVMIVGLGGVGMAALLTALATDGIDVIAVDGISFKREKARNLGATQCFSPKEVVDQGVTADLVVEAAGSARAFETAYGAIAVGGRLVTVSLPAATDTATIAPLALTAGARKVMGSYLGSAVPKRDIPKFADLYLEGKLPLEELITSTIRLDEINEAMDKLADGTEIRQIIKFGNGEG